MELLNFIDAKMEENYEIPGNVLFPYTQAAYPDGGYRFQHHLKYCATRNETMTIIKQVHEKIQSETTQITNNSQLWEILIQVFILRLVLTLPFVLVLFGR